MAYVPLQITLLCADDLEDDDAGDFSSSSMMVYAVVFVVIGYDTYAMQRTPEDVTGGNFPAWHSTMRFLVPRGGPHLQNLHFSLRCRSPRGDYGVGDVMVPLEELLLWASHSIGVGPPWDSEFSYPVTTPAGWQRGTLHFRLRYGEEAARRKDATESEGSPEKNQTRVRTVPSVLTLAAYAGCSPFRTSPPWRNKTKQMAWLLMTSATWLLVLMLCLILFGGHVAGPLPQPLPVILVYGYPALQPPAPPAAVVGGARFRWPAVILLGGLLAAIHLPCCT